MATLGTLFERRKLISGFATFVIFTCCLICVDAHSVMHIQDPDVLRVKSWKRGNTRIIEKVFTITLASDTPEYEFDFYSIATPEKRFRAHFRRESLSTIRNANLQCWIANLREVTAEVPSVNQLGPNLLSAEGPGIGDNFPREDWGQVFCPVDEPNRVLDGLIYPMRTKRQFYIEGFVLGLSVTDYQLDRDRNELGNVELKISLSNR